MTLDAVALLGILRTIEPAEREERSKAWALKHDTDSVPASERYESSMHHGECRGGGAW